ncbi:MAG TPA: hypothetical protein VFV50_16340, partial [Bdellovibrionales bacterium]|nr:hypothetical protein [Bdellovibrionales bacterium]
PHDYLRANAKSKLTSGPACFGVMFQLYRDQLSTNIEDSTDIWLSSDADRDTWISMLKSGKNLASSYYRTVREKKYSPYIKVATLKIAKIEGDDPARNTKTCEDLSFNPWNGNIELHKPLGIVSRMKRRVYNASRRTRNTINNLPTQTWER